MHAIRNGQRMKDLEILKIIDELTNVIPMLKEKFRVEQNRENERENTGTLGK